MAKAQNHTRRNHKPIWISSLSLRLAKRIRGTRRIFGILEVKAGLKPRGLEACFVQAESISQGIPMSVRASALGLKILACWMVKFTGPTQVIELAIPKSAKEEVHVALTS